MRQRNHLGSIGRSSHYFSVLCVLFRKIFLSVGLYSESQKWLPPLGLSFDRKNQTAAAPIPTTRSAISMIDYLLQGLNAQEYEYSMTSHVSRFGQQHLQKHLFIKERYLRTVRKILKNRAVRIYFDLGKCKKFWFS